MKPLVKETLNSLAHQIEQSEAEVTIGSLPAVTADRTAMEQIMGNLLANAVTYLVPGRPGHLDIRGERHELETVFHVCDNGRGIAAADLPKLFQPFSRLGEPVAPGEGMGLAYVQTLVRRHGGRITCESTPGRGTTFTFTISNRLNLEDKDG
jgi:signal transduction histidine kinase